MKNRKETIKDPVCGRRINRNKAYAKIKYNKQIYYVCCPLCQSEFEKDPAKFIKVITKHR